MAMQSGNKSSVMGSLSFVFQSGTWKINFCQLYFVINRSIVSIVALILFIIVFVITVQCVRAA